MQAMTLQTPKSLQDGTLASAAMCPPVLHEECWPH